MKSVFKHICIFKIRGARSESVKLIAYYISVNCFAGEIKMLQKTLALLSYFAYLICSKHLFKEKSVHSRERANICKDI